MRKRGERVLRSGIGRRRHRDGANDAVQQVVAVIKVTFVADVHADGQVLGDGDLDRQTRTADCAGRREVAALTDEAGGRAPTCRLTVEMESPVDSAISSRKTGADSRTARSTCAQADRRERGRGGDVDVAEPRPRGQRGRRPGAANAECGTRGTVARRAVSVVGRSRMLVMVLSWVRANVSSAHRRRRIECR